MIELVFIAQVIVKPVLIALCIISCFCAVAVLVAK